jgi:SAM-dependent methyltransferase
MKPDLVAFETALLNDVPSLMALRSGFRFGMFRKLMLGPVTVDDLILKSTVPHAGLLVLLQIFQSNGIAYSDDAGWHLHPIMYELLDANWTELSAKVDFTSTAVCDVLGHGDLLLRDPQGFLHAAQTFKFFRYDRALGVGAAHLQDTAPWVDYVSALTAREAPDLTPLIELENACHLLEIGGNTGVFAQALLSRYPKLLATVIDLPAVCRLGENRMSNAQHGARLTFLAGDARNIEWPDADTVLFKSVLHDWSEDGAAIMLQKAAAHVPPGGRVIICERGPIADEGNIQGALAAANLVFSQYYRGPDYYRGVLAASGLKLLPSATVKLDMTFHITMAVRVA